MGIKKFIKKIIKIIEYIPIIWHDEDWDYDYLLKLIKYKITRMKKCIKDNDIIILEDISEIEEQIDKTIKSIDDYNMAHELYEQEFGDIYEILGIERLFEQLDNGNSHLVSRYKDSGLEVKPRHEAKISKYYKDMMEYENKKWDDIWENMRKYSRNWWD